MRKTNWVPGCVAQRLFGAILPFLDIFHTTPKKKKKKKFEKKKKKKKKKTKKPKKKKPNA